MDTVILSATVGKHLVKALWIAAIELAASVCSAMSECILADWAHPSRIDA